MKFHNPARLNPFDQTDRGPTPAIGKRPDARDWVTVMIQRVSTGDKKPAQGVSLPLTFVCFVPNGPLIPERAQKMVLLAARQPPCPKFVPS